MGKTKGTSQGGNITTEYLTLYLGDQLFGLPILKVQDVLGEQNITRIPKASEEIKGALNLRGRIVTAIDVRTLLNIKSGDEKAKTAMSVVLEHKHELFSLQIEKVGDVMALKQRDMESNPPTLDERWRNISEGVFRLDGRLLIILDIEKLFETITPKNSAA